MAAPPAQAAFPGENGRIAMDYLGGVFSLRPDGRDLRRHDRNGFSAAYSRTAACWRMAAAPNTARGVEKASASASGGRTGVAAGGP